MQFIAFLNELSKDYLNHSDTWENTSINAFIEQIASWIEDYSTCPPNDINWDKIDYESKIKDF